MSKKPLKTLLLGGNGLLGSYLKIVADRPSHHDLDITEPYWSDVWYKRGEYDLIVHAAAYTNVQGANTDKYSCFNVNVYGTMNVLLAYPNIPIVYISTEYVFDPVNFYSLTKKMSEELIMKCCPNHMIIRTLFKATPWPFEKAFIDQWTQGDSVDIIAPLIDQKIMDWNRRGQELIYVGTGRKRIYDIAIKTKPDVIPNSIKDMITPIPADYEN